MMGLDSYPIRQRRLHGVRQILEFNWPQYVVGLAVVSVAGTIAAAMPIAVWRATLIVGAALGTWWLLMSILVSWWIYDHSGLTSWQCLRADGDGPARWLNVHAGFDETSDKLAALWPRARGAVVNTHDPATMTEGSLARARPRSQCSIPTLVGRADKLPLDDAMFDRVFLLFAAHEVRSGQTRVQLFKEARRVLAADGKAIIVEHLRNLPNFLAFGLGFFHFFSHGTWVRDAAEAGLTLRRTNLNPFVAMYVGSKEQ